MDIKLTQAQFGTIKSGAITTSFSELDVNKDGTITDADLESTREDLSIVISVNGAF